jgi:hypothetical protein
MSYLEKLKEAYQTATKSDYEGNDYDLKNYFTTSLPSGVEEDTKTIRVLPIKGQVQFWTELHAHNVKVDGSWRKFPCLKHEKNEDCPFCEAREALLKTGKEEDKETAKKYGARKFYVLKVIERGKEDEGVKFWRFGHNYKKQGVLEKIMNAIDTVEDDITDPENGFDLKVYIALDSTMKGGVKVPLVQSVMPVIKPKPLGTKEQMELWLSDERTWEDVYAVKPYEYLELIVKGKKPVWDKKNEKFVSEDELVTEDEELTNEKNALESQLTIGQSTDDEVVSETYDEDDDEVDDLPF